VLKFCIGYMSRMRSEGFAVNTAVCQIGLVALPLFDVTQVDFIFESLCTRQHFYLLFCNFMYYFMINIEIS